MLSYSVVLARKCSDKFLATWEANVSGLNIKYWKPQYWEKKYRLWKKYSSRIKTNLRSSRNSFAFQWSELIQLKNCKTKRNLWNAVGRWKYSSTKECNSLGLGAQYLCWRKEKFLMKNLRGMFRKEKRTKTKNITAVKLEPIKIAYWNERIKQLWWIIEIWPITNVNF